LGTAVDKGALGEIFLPLLRLSLVSVSPHVFRVHPFIKLISWERR